MERERMKLALEDRPVRSEFEALNELHEDRLRTTEAELRRLIAELSNRLQVCRTEAHATREMRGEMYSFIGTSRRCLTIAFRIPSKPGRSTLVFH